MGVTPASVTEMMQTLGGHGLCQLREVPWRHPDPQGERIGAKIKRKHRLMERFLVDVIGLDKAESHKEACSLEHTLSDESEKRICQMMNNPKTCPDGDPIPACDQDCRMCISEPSIPLTEVGKGEMAVITHLRCEDTGKMRRVIAMGLVPWEEHLC